MPPSVAPVAATFLERLLFDIDATEALSTLSSIWSLRTRTQVAQFGLSEAEYVVQLCLIYSGEVANGGHAQFFLNRGGQYVTETLHALRVTELPELAGILQRADATFSGGSAPIEQGAIEEELDKFTETQWRSLGQCDRELFQLLASVDTRLLMYVRTNQHQILLPETPRELRTGRCAVDQLPASLLECGTHDSSPKGKQ